MHIGWELTEGPGFWAESALTANELARVRGMIDRQYLQRMNRFAPDRLDEAARIGIENYHLLRLPFDHATTWTKETRLLPQSCVGEIAGMRFFRRIEKDFGPVVVSHDELNWRLVRPDNPNDVGPIHADKWFWDCGYGQGSMAEGTDRFKIWIPICTEPGANGLSVLPHSHKVETWKHHFEVRNGIRKPVLDERVEDLNMQLLPLKPGEMVMFHDKLLHGGVVNRGQKCRVSIELTILFSTAEAAQRLRQFRRRSARRPVKSKQLA